MAGLVVGLMVAGCVPTADAAPVHGGEKRLLPQFNAVDHRPQNVDAAAADTAVEIASRTKRTAKSVPCGVIPGKPSKPRRSPTPGPPSPSPTAPAPASPTVSDPGPVLPPPAAVPLVPTPPRDTPTSTRDLDPEPAWPQAPNVVDRPEQEAVVVTPKPGRGATTPPSTTRTVAPVRLGTLHDPRLPTKKPTRSGVTPTEPPAPASNESTLASAPPQLGAVSAPASVPPTEDETTGEAAVSPIVPILGGAAIAAALLLVLAPPLLRPRLH